MFFKIKKIINDPVYGIINIPDGIIFSIFEHPYFQRLRRISQAGLTNYVYPGANHTRFHHALGSMHLCLEALDMLIIRGIQINKDEAQGLIIAILLHDIGHGPFSHVLEHDLTGQHHETMTLAIMEKLNKEFDGELTTAIEIFSDKHPKKFLHQLVSGQLDLDRMDYLNRDSFFTGVAEGKIGYDRIIKMMTVINNSLVIEEKGIYSVENFLMARRLMYWQVYLHKTVLASEQMLIQCLKRAKYLAQSGTHFLLPEHLSYFLNSNKNQLDDEMLHHFLLIDDYDMWWALKQFSGHEDKSLSYLANALIHRNIFSIELSKERFSEEKVDAIRSDLRKKNYFSDEMINNLVFVGSESNEMYNVSKDEIMVHMKDDSVRPFSAVSDYPIGNTVVQKYFLCYPKLSYIAEV